MFVNRETEIARLRHVLNSDTAQLVVIYGRRRCGKSTLLRHIMDDDSVYFSADMREAPLQIKTLSERIEKIIPGFAAPVYPGWDSLFRSMNVALKKRFTICIDEFPYLVKNSPELPSVLQNIHDDASHSNYNLIICGSSQMMMQGLVLNSKAPLYGRAGEIMKVHPMPVACLKRYLGISATEAVTEYSIWGGVPRYWEIRKASDTLDAALSHHVVNQYGLLADEPERLFSDEARTSVQAYTLLSLIGSGYHRISEMAARIGKPATHLSGVLAFLTELRYIRREIPFGESLRSTRKTLYKIDDPFLNFWFTFIVAEKSRIDLGLTSQAMKRIKNRLPSYVASVWEELCRKSVPFLNLDMEFNPASRWWGRGIDGNPMEIDLLAGSADGKVLLAGECKWTEKAYINKLSDELAKKAANLPFADGRTVIMALFLKNKPVVSPSGLFIFGPEEVVDALK
ncbi:MAG: ATP-binding protein [Bacteroidales bacterium]|nr:ATP-binding protein [Bacteroidales bacterium]